MFHWLYRGIIRPVQTHPRLDPLEGPDRRQIWNWPTQSSHQSVAGHFSKNRLQWVGLHFPPPKPEKPDPTDVLRIFSKKFLDSGRNFQILARFSRIRQDFPNSNLKFPNSNFKFSDFSNKFSYFGNLSSRSSDISSKSSEISSNQVRFLSDLVKSH